jgi:hypothetical protein
MTPWVSVRGLLAHGHAQTATAPAEPARKGWRISERTWKTAYWTFFTILAGAPAAILVESLYHGAW